MVCKFWRNKFNFFGKALNFVFPPRNFDCYVDKKTKNLRQLQYIDSYVSFESQHNRALALHKNNIDGAESELT